MTSTPALTHKEEKRYLHILFFLFGFGIMAWVPRFPELKDNLGLSNGAFGSILTTGSIGAFLGLLTVGHIVHKVGVFKVTLAGILLLFGAFTAIVHVHNPIYFAFYNIILGFAITTLHVSLNTQGFHVQERSGDIVVTSSAGYWSAGALGTAILSGIFVGNIGLSLHIDAISIMSGAIMIWILVKLNPVLVSANDNSETDYSIKDIFTSFHLDWPVSLGLATAVYLEFAIGDWGTIFTKERLDINSGLSSLPYIIFTIFMIFGRLSVQKILHRYKIQYVAKTSALLAGLSFGICIGVAVNLPIELKWVSYALFLIGFALAGLGSAVLGPSYTSAANKRSPNPSSVVVGQLGVANNVLTTALKWIVAGVIAATGSIAVALMIPAVLMVISASFTHVLKED